MTETISQFLFQIGIVLTLVNMLVNMFKPLWQKYPWQSIADLGTGFVFSIALCMLFRVDGIAILLGIAFPEAPVLPWYVGTIITGLLGEKLAALLNDMTKSIRGKI